ERELARLDRTFMGPQSADHAAITALLGQPLERESSLRELLRRPEVRYGTLTALPSAGPGVDAPQVAEQVEVAVKYEGYIDRQRAEVARQREYESLLLPGELDYSQVRGLSTEVQQKLNLH